MGSVDAARQPGQTGSPRSKAAWSNTLVKHQSRGSTTDRLGSAVLPARQGSPRGRGHSRVVSHHFSAARGIRGAYGVASTLARSSSGRATSTAAWFDSTSHTPVAARCTRYTHPLLVAPPRGTRFDRKTRGPVAARRGRCAGSNLIDFVWA